MVLLCALFLLWFAFPNAVEYITECMLKVGGYLILMCILSIMSIIVYAMIFGWW